MSAKNLVTACYFVPGLPHILLAPERSKGWGKLHDAYAQVRKEIEASDAEMILYFSTQWLSVLGYLFQADPSPEWVHVDHNWHELGSMPYNFKIETGFASAYANEVRGLGHYVREVNYKGFPIDTGTIVAQKLINPTNRLPAAIASCNIYAEKQETLSFGQAAIRAIEKYGKRVAVVVVSGLSSRFEVRDINPAEDKISSLKDDEWNRKVLEIFGDGRLEDVSEVAREYARQANADMGFKAVWWLNGLCGKTNDFTGRVFEYQPVWGTGAALVGLYPTKPVRSIPNWVNDEADLVERMSISSSANASSAGLAPGEAREKARQQSAPAATPAATPVFSATSLATARASVGERISSSKAPPPVGSYPHARVEGEFIYLSGCGPRKPGTTQIPGVTLNDKGDVAEYDVEVQTRSVIENIKVILESAGAALDDVIDVQAYLTNTKKDFATFNRVYGEYFGSRKDAAGVPIGPCRTTVEVGALPTPIAVELKVIARKPSSAWNA